MSIFNQSKNGTAAVEPEPSTEVEKAVHVALGIPAAVADVINDAVERWTDSEQRDKDLQALREQLPTQVEKSLKVVEQRSDEVRKQAVEQARSTRERVEPTLRKVSDQARTRGQKLSDTTQEQVARVRKQLA